MTDNELNNWCINQLAENKSLKFPNEIFISLSPDQAQMLAKNFGDFNLMYLPEKEVKFFEWLKKEDYDIWFDLWGNDETGNEPYLVSMTFLPLFLEESRGFPICDLLKNDNYYFTDSHIVDEESKMMIDSAKERVQAKEPLTVAQLLALEISFSPIDIWRFAYHHNVQLSKAKEAVKVLVEDGVLIHIKDAESLTRFINI